MIAERFGHALGAHDGPPLEVDALPGLAHRRCSKSRVDMRCACGACLRGPASLAAKSCGWGLSPQRVQRAQHHSSTEAS